MPVYMVYVCHSVSDRAQLEKYWASIAPTLKDYSSSTSRPTRRSKSLKGRTSRECS
jgi:hypothetical protein